MRGVMLRQCSGRAEVRPTCSGSMRILLRQLLRDAEQKKGSAYADPKGAINLAGGLVFGAGSTRLRRLAVFDAAFVAKVAAFLRLALGLGAVAVFEGFFLHIAGSFLDLSFDAHDTLHWLWVLVRETLGRGRKLPAIAQIYLRLRAQLWPHRGVSRRV